MHNLWFLLGLMGRVRESIVAGTFDALRDEVTDIWARPPLN